MNVYSNFKVKLIHLYILALIGGGGNHKYIFLLKILEFMVSLVLLLSKQLPPTPKLSNGPYSSEYAFLYRDMDQIPKFTLKDGGPSVTPYYKVLPGVRN